MILVVGPGGNGQTYFMQFLLMHGLHINSDIDADGQKHLASPNDAFSKNSAQYQRFLKTKPLHHYHQPPKIDRCIFLYNHPYDSLLSHFRREYSVDQCNKLGNPYRLPNHLLQLKNFPLFQSLTLEKQTDLFGFMHQYNNWLKEPTPYPVLFLNFKDVLQRQNELDAFLQTKLDFSKFKEKNRFQDVVQKKDDLHAFLNTTTDYTKFKNIDHSHTHTVVKNAAMQAIYDVLYNKMVNGPLRKEASSSMQSRSNSAARYAVLLPVPALSPLRHYNRPSSRQQGMAARKLVSVNSFGS
jgi:hypothetical protein